MLVSNQKWTQTVPKVYLVLALFIAIKISNTDATLILKPSGEAYVCPGGRLTLTCSTNASLMQWNVTVPHFQTSQTRLLPYTGTAQRATPIIIGSITFNISRVLNESLPLPLVSVITVDGVTSDINETVVRCLEVPGMTTLTRVQIIEINSVPAPPSLANSSRERFGEDNVVVTLFFLDWNQEIGTFYYVSATPDIPIVWLTGNTSIQLTVSYNTFYNVSIVATLCGRVNTTISITLKYAQCGYPLKADVNELLNIVGYMNPALEGTTVSFRCLSGLVLTGPSNSTCMGNGEWEPDPGQVDCKANCGPLLPPSNSHVYPYTTTLEGAVAKIMCHENIHDTERFIAMCTQEGHWEINATGNVCTEVNENSATVLSPDKIIVVASSVTIMSSILLLSAGFILGYCLGRKCKPRSTSVAVHQDTPSELTTQNLELMDNVAYETIN